MLAGYSFAISVASAASWARSDGREGAHRVENAGAPTGPSSAPYGGLARAGSSSDPNHGRTGSIIPIHDHVARKSAAEAKRRPRNGRRRQQLCANGVEFGVERRLELGRGTGVV